MSKSRIRLLIMGTIAALLFTGVAFASWSDEIVVTAVAASGEVNVEITSSEVYAVSNFVEFDNSDINIAENKKSAQVNIGKNYPGSQVKYGLVITNTGSLPVKLSEIVHNKINVVDTKTAANLGKDSALFGYIDAEYYLDVYNAEGIKIGSSAIVNTENSNEWVIDYFVDNTLPEIQPGGYVRLFTRVYFDSDAPESMENKAYTFSITPLFEQVG